MDERARIGRSRSLIAAVAIAAAVWLAGCSLQQIAVRQTADIFAEGQSALDSESDPIFAEKALPANIKTLEALLVNDPENEKLLNLLAESYFGYAFGFMEGELARAEVELESEAEIEQLTNRTVDKYMRARDYGFRLLDRPELRQAALDLKSDKVKDLLEETSEEDVPGLFWAANSWGSAINLAQQDPDMVAAVPVVVAMMRRVLELDETYFYSGPHVFFGIYYASRPAVAGGDPDKAIDHFETALKQHGDVDLMIPYLYGRYVGAQTQDRELFDEMMDRVLSADLSEHPETRLRNEIAHRRARFWKEHADDIFFE